VSTPPWWLRWLWLNLILAAVVSVCYLLAVSVEEFREWFAAEGYFARRREGRGALIVFILLSIQVVGLLTASCASRSECVSGRAGRSMSGSLCASLG
jgi:hypothetical protein